MTRVRRGRGIAAILATLAAAALATTTAPGDADAATGIVRSSTPAKTTLHLHIAGCDRCSVQLQHAVRGKPHVWTSASRRIGPDHRVVFAVRTARTKGLSFVLRAPWQGDTGAVPNMVTRYVGHAIDSHVSRTAARHARRAEGCWAGTTLADVRLHFRVARVPAKTVDGQATEIPLVYATHSMSSWKPMVKTYKGTIANQDAFYCFKPPTTAVTLRAPGCNGCQLQVMNAARYAENFWGSRDKTVSRGAVTFHVPRPVTRGISATVVAPWEGATGYTTLIAWRYAGHHVGEPVSFKDARAQSRGSACWGGTSQRTLAIDLTVRKVTVPGTTGPAAGTIAYAEVTQPWLRPMLDAGKGVLGAQEQILCHR
jgi:hypothetical protein